ncbi:hypothetical protein BH11BAC2_BH11BAC2_01900 [soil metagenome]
MKTISSVLVYLLCAVLFCSCSPKTGFAQRLDGSDRLSHSDSMTINIYDGQPLKTMSSGFYLIKASDITPMLKESKITWVVILSSNDSGAVTDFTNYTAFWDSIRHNINIGFIPIFLNYDIQQTRKLLAASGYGGTVFIVDAGVYGKDESSKHQQFVSELFGAPSYKLIFPDHFICDNTLKIRYHFNGPKISGADILSGILPSKK